MAAPTRFHGGASLAVDEVIVQSEAAAVGWPPAGGVDGPVLQASGSMVQQVEATGYSAVDAEGLLLLQPMDLSAAAQPALSGLSELAVADVLLPGAEVMQPPSSTIAAAPPSSPMPLQSTVLRRSARHAVALDGSSSTDEDALAKAMRRKAELLSDNAGKNNSSKSFLSFSNSNISSKLHKVGISLGKDDSNIAMSTKALRHLEFDRLTVAPKGSCKSVTSQLDEEEHDDTIDVQLLSHLVGDVSEGGLDEAALSSLYDLKVADQKSKTASLKKKKKSPRKQVKSSTIPTVSK